MDELHVDSKHAKHFKKKDRCILRGIFIANEIQFQTDDIEKLREAKYSEKFPMKKIYQDFHLYISVKICWRFFLPISLCKSWICPNIDFNCTSLTSVCIFVINHQKVADTVTLDKVLRLMYSNTPITCHCYICKGGVIEDVLYTLRNYIESEYINIAFKT